jgi:hypothetical protein
MSHDSTKVLMGATKSSLKTVTSHAGSIAAGLATRISSAGALTVTESAGSLLGVSLGKDLSDSGRTAICRKGEGVPILLDDGLTPVIGTQVQISTTTGKAVASGTAVNAVYKSAVLTGILEDGTEANVAVIDFVGGL